MEMGLSQIVHVSCFSSFSQGFVFLFLLGEKNQAPFVTWLREEQKETGGTKRERKKGRMEE